MKKILLATAALLMVVSGVAAVSAYEAHLINVTAHVENALEVDTTAINYGTVFPEEWLLVHRSINLSRSAIAEKGVEPGDLKDVVLRAFAEWKPVPAGTTVNPVVSDGAGNSYYAWLGEALYVAFDYTGSGASGMALVGAAPAGPPGAKPILATVTLDGITSATLDVGLDVPVFEGFYNPLTDPEPKPSGLNDPTWIILKTDYRYFPNGVDLGLDLKVQVIDINRVP